MSRIVRSTLAEQVYTDLRDRILSGRFAAGQRLMPEELAGDLAISPTPIKEALLRLATDGLVETETRRGAIVRRFTAADVAELYEARQLVEGYALAQGFVRRTIDTKAIAELRALQNALVARRSEASQDGLTEALALDRAFHTRLVALAGNSVLTDWHARIVAQTHTMRVYSLESYKLERLQAEHEAILSALAEADQEAASAALERHLRQSRNELLTRLPKAPAP